MKIECVPRMPKIKRRASTESSQTTWKGETVLLYIRIHPLQHVELHQEWQAQINPPAGRWDLTTDCASEPP